MPFISLTDMGFALSCAKISFTHIRKMSSSSFDIVLIHSFVTPSGPGALLFFR